MDDHFNLLDSVISGTEYCIKSDHSDILNSKKPDKEIEYFWLTFKDSIIKYVHVKFAEYIKVLSNELNELQKLEKYDDIKNKISEFMHKYIELICKQIILKNDHYMITHLETNINRWIKYDSEFAKYIEKIFFVRATLVISKISKKKKDNISYIVSKVIELFNNDTYDIYLDIFKYAVKNNMSLVAELVAPYINFSTYFNDAQMIDSCSNMKGHKLVKLFSSIFL
jgi:hypothetical protein